MSYNNSSYFFSQQIKPIAKVNDDQSKLLVTFLQLLDAEFGKTYRYCTYPDHEYGCRVAIIFDDDGEELIRMHLDSTFRTDLPIVRESYNYFANFERQLERFWLKLYEKYKINKNEFYKRHKLKKLYR